MTAEWGILYVLLGVIFWQLCKLTAAVIYLSDKIVTPKLDQIESDVGSIQSDVSLIRTLKA